LSGLINATSYQLWQMPEIKILPDFRHIVVKFDNISGGSWFFIGNFIEKLVVTPWQIFSPGCQDQ